MCALDNFAHVAPLIDRGYHSDSYIYRHIPSDPTLLLPFISMQNSGHCDKAGAGGYNETTFVQTMEALISTGLDKLGYVYLNADVRSLLLFSFSPRLVLLREIGSASRMLL